MWRRTNSLTVIQIELMSTSLRTHPRLAFALAAMLFALLSASPSRAGLTEESIPAEEMPIALATAVATPLATPVAAEQAPPMAVIATTPGGGPEIAAPPEVAAPPVAAMAEPSATLRRWRRAPRAPPRPRSEAAADRSRYAADHAGQRNSAHCPDRQRADAHAGNLAAPHRTGAPGYFKRQGGRGDSRADECAFDRFQQSLRLLLPRPRVPAEKGLSPDLDVPGSARRLVSRATRPGSARRSALKAPATSNQARPRKRLRHTGARWIPRPTT